MRLQVKILNKTFDNPLLPASGPSVGSLKSLEFFNNSQVGGVVTKTISIKGAQVNKPCIVAQDGIVYNTEKWSELDLNTWLEEILPQFKGIQTKPLIVCAGYTAEDFRQSIPLLEPFADFFEVSTHYDKDALKSLVTEICGLTTKPVFIKLSPHVTNYIDFIQTAIDCGASGVVAINSVGPGLVVDLLNRSLKIGNEDGSSWISGPAIKPIALQRVMTIRKHFPDLPIIACGGVKNAKDVLEFILAGADLVQMLSSALLYGRQSYDKVVGDLEKVMDDYHIEDIESLRRTELSLQHKGQGHFPRIDDRCVKCNKCVDVCPEMALQLHFDVEVDQSRCIRCGLCESICPSHAISGVLT